MEGRGKREKFLVVGVSTGLLLIFMLIYTVATSALNQESKWAGCIDKFDQYYSDFQSLADAMLRLTDGQEEEYFIVDKYEPVFIKDQNTISLSQSEAANLWNIQILFSETTGFLGSIAVKPGQVSFRNITGKYAVLYTDEDVPPKSTEETSLTAIKIRPHWYHVAYD